jgi:pimeloyl-ACP methyl ester carboxylesterase
MNRSLTKVLLPAVLAALIATTGPALAKKAWDPPTYYAEELYAEIEGMKICYLEAGAGNPETIVFVHGWSGDVQNWWDQYDYFSSRYHVLILDNPGHGKSERRADLDYSTELMGRAVIGLLDHVGVKKAHVVGNSLGGQVSEWVAIHHPDRVNKLILSAAAGAHDYRWLVGVAPFINPLSIRLMGVTTGGRYSGDDPRQRARDDFTASFEGTDQEWPYLKALARAIRYLVLHPVKADLSKISAPTLLIWGDDDTTVRPEDMDIFARLIPDTSRYLIRQGGHTPMISKSAEFNCAVDKFLAGEDMEECHGLN